MKVLFVQIIRGLSGSEKYFIEIMPMLKKQGIDCEFLCVHLTEDQDKYKVVTTPLEQSGIKVHCIESRNTLNYGLLKAINTVVKAGQYDLLHAHLLYSEVWLTLVKILFNRKLKLVSTKHGYDEKFTHLYGFDPSKRLYNLYYFLCRFTEKFMLRSFTISQGLHKLFIGINICKADKLDLIYYGFEKKFATLRQENTYREAPQQLLIVGRLMPYKGHTYVLDAMPKVIEQFPDVKLLIIGTGPIEQELKEQVKTLQIEKAVDFKGYSTAAMQYMASSDILIVPSKSEGFGIVFVEAFEVKTPIVAFDVHASNELIEDGKSGHLVRPFDVDEMAEKIIDLLIHPEKRKLFVENGYKRLAHPFNPKRMVTETMTFYERVLKNEK